MTGDQYTGTDYTGGEQITNVGHIMNYKYPLKTGDRIKLAFIAPIFDLDLSQWGQHHFILAHLVHAFPDTYGKFFVNEKKWKLIDNSSYELGGQPIENMKLLGAAVAVGASEIVLPDIMFDREATFKSTLSFLNDRKVMDIVEYEGFKLMYIPQGRTVGEYIKSYLHDAAFFVGEYANIQAVGFPIWLDRHARREGVINYIDRRFGLLDCDHHLLGIDDYSELLNYPEGLIRSADSSRVFTLASHGVAIDNLFNMAPADHSSVGYDRVPLEIKMDNNSRELAMRNIQDVLNYTRYRERK